ncbi:MAG: hypothetical protein IPK67_17830 [Planctomycetes bacterium]|nr:hypothetical protein [Planctomycetota bacterium]
MKARLWNSTGGRAPRASGLPALTLCALLFHGAARAEPATQVEGPLNNDAYLPVDAAAESELSRGDQAFAAALSGKGLPGKGTENGDPAARWTTALEAWRNALVRSAPRSCVAPRPTTAPGEVSPWPTADGGPDRHTEGLELAVFRRLAALPPDGRAAWRARFSPLAQQALSRAGRSPEALARVERELCATEGAVQAALGLSELALEEGEIERARSWLGRARRHWELLIEEDARASGGESSTAEVSRKGALQAAIDRRLAALPPGREPAAQDFEGASTLTSLVLRELEPARGSSVRARALGSGPQAGLGFLENGAALLVTPGNLWVLGLGDGSLGGPFDHRAWLESAGFSAPTAVAPGNAPGWRMDPAMDGNSAIVVVGRSLAGRPNLIARVKFDPRGNGAPELLWARRASPAQLDPGPAREIPQAVEHPSGDEYEFGPGPLWLDQQVLVLVRRAGAASGERELELRAYDPETGALLWSHFLGKGGERVRDAGRFAARGAPSMPAEPLLLTQAGVLASGQLGFAALVDPLDGRPVFSVRNHRRDPSRAGWTGWGAAPAPQGVLAGWAPADADYLYLLRTAENAADGPPGTGPLARTPAPIGEAEGLVDADASGALVIARSGARWVLSRLDFESGGRVDALRLGPEECFTGRALATPSRVFAASDRALYLFDRTRDLELLAAPALGGATPRGGNAYGRGNRIVVLSTRQVELFEAR